MKQEGKQCVGTNIPTFNVVRNGYAEPISSGQRFDLALHGVGDAFGIGVAAVLGGYSKLVDNHKGYGHGATGYFKRFGAQYGNNTIGTVLARALFPPLLHQDPRYIRKGSSSAKSRLGRDGAFAVVCHRDYGHRQFYESNILGRLTAGAISNTYDPAEEGGTAFTLNNGAVVIVEDILGAEFLHSPRSGGATQPS